MKFFSFLSVLGLLLGVANAGLLGSSECTYGPSYWCHSLQNSAQCKATKHCIQTVWETLNLPADTDSICEICKDMVTQARETLESNETQEELKQVFDGSCRLIPLKEISAECVKLANDFIPELIETLASQMNPQTVCATAGLCNSHRVDRLLIESGLMTVAPVTQDVASPSDCQDCNNFFRDLMDIIRQHSKQEVMDRLLTICGELGSLSDGCSALVATNIDIIYEYLTESLDAAQLCTVFDMCDVALPVSTSGTGKGDEACDFCVVIAQHWRDEMMSKSSEAQFREVLEGICSKTGKFSSECKALVDTYGVSLYEFLANNFNPKAVCEMIGICSQTFKGKPIWNTFHIGPMPADTIIDNQDNIESAISPSLHFVGNDEANSYKNEHLPRPNIKVTVAGETGVLASTDDQLCTMCEFTLHFVQVQLQDQHTREDIEKAVKNVCSLLPKNLHEECGDYIDAYGDQVIALLQQEIDPSIMCPLLGLCPKNENAVEYQTTEVVTCVACEFVMKKVKELLGDRNDEEAVKSALDSVCSILPHSIEGQCTTFVDQNAIEVMQLIAAGVNAEEICRMLKFCKDHNNALPPLSASDHLPLDRLFVPVPQPDNALETTGQTKVCVLCELVMVYVERFVTDNTTHVEDKIQGVLDMVCLHLPSSVQEDCLGFIDQYTKAIVELLLSQATPQTICRQLTLCQENNLNVMAVSAQEPEAPSEERACLICTAVAATSVGARREAGEQASVEALNRLCNVLGDAVEKAFCQNLSSNTFSMESSYTARHQCAGLGYCPAPTGLVGSNQCTWGPSYWCQSAIHAHSCRGSISHCQERVWENGVPPPS